MATGLVGTAFAAGVAATNCPVDYKCFTDYTVVKEVTAGSNLKPEVIEATINSIPAGFYGNIIINVYDNNGKQAFEITKKTSPPAILSEVATSTP